MAHGKNPKTSLLCFADSRVRGESPRERGRDECLGKETASTVTRGTWPASDSGQERNCNVNREKGRVHVERLRNSGRNAKKKNQDYESASRE